LDCGGILDVDQHEKDALMPRPAGPTWCLVLTTAGRIAERHR